MRHHQTLLTGLGTYLDIYLIREDDPDPVIIRVTRLRHVHGSLEVHPGQLGLSDRDARGAVHLLLDLLPLVLELPHWRQQTWVLVLPELNGLNCPEVCFLNEDIAGTNIHIVHDAVPITVLLTRVSDSITIRIFLAGVTDDWAVVLTVLHPIIVSILVTSIAQAVTVSVKLVSVGCVGAGVMGIRNTVLIRASNQGSRRLREVLQSRRRTLLRPSPD